MPAAAPALPAYASTVFCGAVPFIRGEAAALPQRLKILNWGENLGRTTKAKIIVGEKTLACLSANQVATACERVPMDYEHQSVKGHPNFVPDPRPVPGHGEIEIVPNDGVYLSALDYTPSGREFAPNYQDVSAVCYLDAEKNLLFVRSVALTQHGDVAGMEFAESIAASAVFSRSPSETPTATPPPASTMSSPDYRAMLVAALKLSPAEGETEVTDEAIGAAIAKLADAAPGDAAEQVACSAAATAAAASTLAVLSADFEAFKRQTAIDRAIAQGKAIPLTDAVLATLPMAALSALLDGLPAGAVATAGSGTKDIASAKVVALSADQSSAARALGLTDDEFRAGLPAS